METECKQLHVSRSSYNKWASGNSNHRMAENEQLAEKIEKIHMESPDKGYRRINDDLRHDQNIHVNDKRVLRICRVRNIKSTVKYAAAAAPDRQRIRSIWPKIFWIANFTPQSQTKSGLPM